MPKVLMVVASRDFRGEEYACPKDVFEKAGFEVVTASSRRGAIKSAPWGLATTANAALLLDEADAGDYAAIVFVGGSGAKEYFGSRTAHNIARKAVEKGKVLGAICIAPVILARAGVLKGKKATVFPGSEKELEAGGAFPSQESVVADGSIVTANGPEAAKKFAEAVVGLIPELSPPKGC